MPPHDRSQVITSGLCPCPVRPSDRARSTGKPKPIDDQISGQSRRLCGLAASESCGCRSPQSTPKDAGALPPPPRSMGWVVDARPAAAKRLRAQAATTTSAHSSSRGRLRRPGAPAAAGRPSLAFGCEESIPKIGGRVSGRARLHLPPATHGAGGPGASPLTNASSKACEG